MVLSKNHVINVCNVNGGVSCCRYIDETIDDAGQVIDICRKKTVDKKIIDEQILEEIEDLKKQGQNIINSNKHIADNCSGYLLLKSKIQGYDVD